MKVKPTRTIESDSYSVGSDPGLSYLPLVIAEVATVKENGDIDQGKKLKTMKNIS